MRALLSLRINPGRIRMENPTRAKRTTGTICPRSLVQFAEYIQFRKLLDIHVCIIYLLNLLCRILKFSTLLSSNENLETLLDIVFLAGVGIVYLVSLNEYLLEFMLKKRHFGGILLRLTYNFLLFLFPL